jgi:hypothetical protein
MKFKVPALLMVMVVQFDIPNKNPKNQKDVPANFYITTFGAVMSMGLIGGICKKKAKIFDFCSRKILVTSSPTIKKM